MDWAMRLPFKVSTTTSNFMIGVTAAASAGVYLNRGYIDPGLAMPVMLGVLVGSLLGAQLLVRVQSRALRIVFAARHRRHGHPDDLRRTAAGRHERRGQPGWSDQQVEQTIGNLLRIGLLIATGLVLVGGADLSARPRQRAAGLPHLPRRAADLRGLPGIVGAGARLARPRLHPARAVGAAGDAGGAGRLLDRRLHRCNTTAMYVGITLVVLVVLLYSIVGGYV